MFTKLFYKLNKTQKNKNKKSNFVDQFFIMLILSSCVLAISCSPQHAVDGDSKRNDFSTNRGISIPGNNEYSEHDFHDHRDNDTQNPNDPFAGGDDNSAIEDHNENHNDSLQEPLSPVNDVIISEVTGNTADGSMTYQDMMNAYNALQAKPTDEELRAEYIRLNNIIMKQTAENSSIDTTVPNYDETERAQAEAQANAQAQAQLAQQAATEAAQRARLEAQANAQAQAASEAAQRAQAEAQARAQAESQARAQAEEAAQAQSRIDQEVQERAADLITRQENNTTSNDPVVAMDIATRAKRLQERQIIAAQAEAEALKQAQLVKQANEDKIKAEAEAAEALKVKEQLLREAAAAQLAQKEADQKAEAEAKAARLAEVEAQAAQRAAHSEQTSQASLIQSANNDCISSQLTSKNFRVGKTNYNVPISSTSDIKIPVNTGSENNPIMRITSIFGKYLPGLYTSLFNQHNGLDIDNINNGIDFPARALMKSHVVEAAYSNRIGNYVILLATLNVPFITKKLKDDKAGFDHPLIPACTLLKFTYAHLKNKSTLEQGQIIEAGTELGIVGATGTIAFGSHLHLEMEVVTSNINSKAVDRFYDPLGALIVRRSLIDEIKWTIIDKHTPEEAAIPDEYLPQGI